LLSYSVLYYSFQLASTPTDALGLEAGFQSFGCLRDRTAAAALERSLRLDPATHPRAKQAESEVTRQFKRGTDGRSLGKEVVGHVGGGLDALGRLPLPAPTSALWEWGRRGWTVSLSLRSGSSPDHPPARKLADALDIIRRYDQLRTVIYTDGSAGGVKRGGSVAVVTSGDPGNPTFLDVRHQFGPEHTTSLEVDMWRLWLALDCLDNETAAAGVALNALKENGHSAHSILSPLRARLRGLEGRVWSLLIAAFPETRGRMRRPGRLPTLA
jgi:hypothetical protein